MAMSVVNGFLCYSSCDAAKAAKGQDPHPRTDVVSQSGGDNARHDGPAVILDGVLKVSGGAGNDGTVPAGANQSNDPTALRNPSPSTNILA